MLSRTQTAQIHGVTPPPRSSEAGIALLLTLVLIVMLSFIIMGLISSMRLEREIAYGYSEETQSRWIGETALAEAIAGVVTATPPPSLSSTWAVAPGIIYTFSPTGVSSQKLWNADNRVGEGALQVLALQENNLNANAWICGANDRYPLSQLAPLTDWASQTNAGAYFSCPSAISCGWWCLGTNYQSAGVSGGVTNPLVARFTYWIDAESCKVNVSTANTRTVSAPYSSQPSDVDLRALLTPYAGNDAGIAALRTAAPFTTLETTRIPNGAWNANQSLGAFNTNKFYVTIYGSDANLDAFGRPRLDLTSLTSDTVPTYTTAYERLTNDFWATTIYPDILTSTTRNSFLKKYGAFGARQILANIVDYQLPFANVPTGNTSLDTNGIPLLYSGLKKCPMIDAVLVHVATNAVGVSNLAVRVYVDLQLVNGYEVARGNGSVAKVELASVHVDYTNPPNSYDFQPAELAEQSSAPLPADIAANSIALLSASAGSPPVFTPAGSLTGADGTPPAVTNVNIRIKRVRWLKQNADNQIVDWMSPTDFSTVYPTVAGLQFPMALTAFTNAIVGNPPAFSGPASRPGGLAKTDPRTRTFAGWTASTTDFANSGPNLQTNWFAWAMPLTDVPYSSRLAPTVYGLLADLRSVPAGAVPTNAPLHRYLIDAMTETPMTSVGQLASIHTGYPWRTIRLRSVWPETTGVAASSATADGSVPGPNYSGLGDPNTGVEGVETNAVPDWVLLDAFTVGPATTIPGRVNINQRFTGPAGKLAARVPPLQSLLYNTTTNIVTSGYLATLAGNLAIHALVTNSPYASATIPIYRTPGEICETLGLGYNTDVTGQPSKADRQQAITRVANLVTTRSDVFTVWIIAEYVQDLAKDGHFDWIYQRQWRLSDTNTPPTGVDPVAWQTNLMVGVVNDIVDGDGLADGAGWSLTTDRVRGRVRIQAVVQRDASDPAHPQYRILYTRYFPG